MCTILCTERVGHAASRGGVGKRYGRWAGGAKAGSTRCADGHRRASRISRPGKHRPPYFFSCFFFIIYASFAGNDALCFLLLTIIDDCSGLMSNFILIHRWFPRFKIHRFLMKTCSLGELTCTEIVTIYFILSFFL